MKFAVFRFVLRTVNFPRVIPNEGFVRYGSVNNGFSGKFRSKTSVAKHFENFCFRKHNVDLRLSSPMVYQLSYEVGSSA